MADDEIQAKIEELRQPPSLPVTRKDRRRHVVGYVGLVVGSAALVVAISVGVRGSQTADCLNTNLGARNAPNVADRVAQKEMFKAQANALAEVFLNPRQGLTDFQTAVDAYNKTAAIDDAARADNPIGKC